jgi:two-component system sensor histidine kinase AlgZ
LKRYSVSYAPSAVDFALNLTALYIADYYSKKRYYYRMSTTENFSIPRLCRNSSLLVVVLVTQMFALIVALLLRQDEFSARLGAISLYCQWIALMATAALCMCRTRLNHVGNAVAIIGTALCCLMPALLTEFCIQFFVLGLGWTTFDSGRFWSYSAVAVVITILVIRLFSILAIIELRNKAEMSLRIQTLQSRIRAHFLFNSLNTIAELTSTNQIQAEQAIESLSVLFRASLENEKRFHSLKSELSLCERYVDLERWRLAERLHINWSVEISDPGLHQVPKLILQPLLENAILHGEQDDGQINVKIDVRETKHDLSLMIGNTIGHQSTSSNSGHGELVRGPSREGNGIAVDNIRERLFNLYDDKQKFRVRQTAAKYSVLMRFPKQNLNDRSEYQ